MLPIAAGAQYHQSLPIDTSGSATALDRVGIGVAPSTQYPAVLWTHWGREAGNDYTFYAEFDGSGWVTDTLADAAAIIGPLAFAPDNRPAALLSGGLTYIKNEPSGWQWESTLPIENYLSTHPSLAFDPVSGQPRFVYQELVHDGSEWRNELRMAARNEGGVWSLHYPYLSATRQVDDLVSLAYAPNGTPNIAIVTFPDAGNAKWELRYVSAPDGFWVDGMVDSSAFGSTPVVGVDPVTGVPHLAWARVSSDESKRYVAYLRRDGSEWMKTIVDSCAVEEGGFLVLSASVDSAGYEHIFYLFGVSPQVNPIHPAELRYGWRPPPTLRPGDGLTPVSYQPPFQIESIVSTGSLGAIRPGGGGMARFAGTGYGRALFAWPGEDLSSGELHLYWSRRMPSASVPGGPLVASRALRVVPNPIRASGALSVWLESDAKDLPREVAIDVFDIAGRRVVGRQVAVAGGKRLELGALGYGLKPGIYSVRLSSQRTEIGRARFVCIE